MLSFEQFVKDYHPLKNKVIRGAPIDGFMYETFGKEYDELKAMANEYAAKEGGKNGYHVWTVVDGGDNDSLVLINGWHLVNRLGYVITENRWIEGETIEVEV